MTDSPGRPWQVVTERLPLFLFFGMYIFSCYIGVILLIISKTFWAWTNLFSGPALAPLDGRGFYTVLILLHGGPILLWLGYEAGLAVWRKFPKWNSLSEPDDAIEDSRFAAGFWICSVGGALISLARSGAFENIGAWTNYNAYISARWHLFDTLSFIEYVNLYTWLPISSALLILYKRRWRIAFGVLGILCVLQLSLFLKKSLLTSGVMIACIMWAYWMHGRRPRISLPPNRLIAWTGCLCALLYLIHAGLTVRLVLSADLDSAIQQAEKAAKQETAASATSIPGDRHRILSPAETSAAVVRFDRALVPAVTGRSLALYAFFAPLTRTSVPAIAYSQLFPDIVSFYHLDLGLDMLGFGRMPDDNRVINNILWPTQKGGSVAVPFHFVLYSQGGIWIALVGSFMVGAFLAGVWYPCFLLNRPSKTMSLVAGLVLIFSWLNAIDSLRNNALVSYGIFWGGLPLIFAYACERYERVRIRLKPTQIPLH